MSLTETFQHLVPTRLVIENDRLRRQPKVNAFLAAEPINGGWRIGIIIKRGPLQADRRSDLIIRNIEDPRAAMQRIGQITLADGVDDIVALFRHGDKVYQALFTSDNLQGMVTPRYNEPVATSPGEEEINRQITH